MAGERAGASARTAEALASIGWRQSGSRLESTEGTRGVEGGGGGGGEGGGVGVVHGCGCHRKEVVVVRELLLGCNVSVREEPNPPIAAHKPLLGFHIGVAAVVCKPGQIPRGACIDSPRATSDIWKVGEGKRPKPGKGYYQSGLEGLLESMSSRERSCEEGFEV